MKNIVLYYDGGESLLNEKGKKLSGKQIVHAWGIVALHNDEHVELYGRKLTAHNFKGYHELQAFVEAMLYAQSHGYSFNQMTFFADDQDTSFASFALHEGNLAGVRRAKLVARLKLLCDTGYTQKIFEDALECLRTSRFNWVKGHKRCVYNLRADYLVSVGFKVDKQHKMLHFDRWLKQGFSFFDTYGEQHQWQPAWTPNEGELVC